MSIHSTKTSAFFLFVLRIVVGWFIAYQGISTITNEQWTLLPHIIEAQTFSGFYDALMDPAIMPMVGYGIRLLYIVIGACMILGIFFRTAALLGACLMLFFYFPGLAFPYADDTYYIVDEYLLVASTLLYLVFSGAGKMYSIGRFFRSSHHD